MVKIFLVLQRQTWTIYIEKFMCVHLVSELLVLVWNKVLKKNPHGFDSQGGQSARGCNFFPLKEIERTTPQTLFRCAWSLCAVGNLAHFKWNALQPSASVTDGK